MESAALFRLLGDEARLRMLRLLAAEQLNVSELTGILGIAQSGVSRHLGLLKDAGLVEERREAGFTYFRLAPALVGGGNGFGPVWPMLRAHFDIAAVTPQGRADAARLEEVRRVRREDFDQHGAAPEHRQIVPGRSWAAWARALAHLLPPLDVADLGCGEGYLAIEAARFARTVVAVDRSEAVLARAKKLAAQRLGSAPASTTPTSRANAVSEPRERTEPPKRRARERVGEFEGRSPSVIQWKRGELDHLPLDDASVDVALLSQALHHAALPARAIAEAVRIVRPGGRVLVLDLRRHEEHWVKDRLGDTWLGFEDAELKQLLEGAGLTDIKLTVGARRQRDPFTVLIASGTRPPELKKAH
ncbi:MAG TPA: metalloregulator ArsR/SmtB family transcription factor [Vicinamibacterales bacterium]